MVFDRSKEASRSLGKGRLKRTKRFYVDLFSDAFNVTKLCQETPSPRPPQLSHHLAYELLPLKLLTSTSPYHNNYGLGREPWDEAHNAAVISL